ncbi:MAG: MFS transporter [Acidimicrobiia bacterium]|nr:MAG: MFS transporter [Acidimicrobiia bacterium]
MTAAVETPARPKLSRNYWRLWTGSVFSNLGDGIGFIAHAWLASAVTRDPVLISLIAVASRLPWLVFTLPAGVITDRVDRRKLMVAMDVVRAGLVFAVAFTVLAAQSGLPSPAEVAAGVSVSTDLGLYTLLLVVVLLMGMAEVLRDNSAQTFLPSIVKPENLERANGTLWGAEMVMNSFVGPPIGSLLLGIGFALPFFLNAGGFALAAGLVFLISGEFRSSGRTEAQNGVKVDWKGEVREGFAWLWRHPVLRSMAIILGILNALGMMTFSTFILFAQENLDMETGLFTGVLRPVASAFGADSVAAFIFSVMMMAGAIGGVLGSILAPRVAAKMGRGPALYMTIVVGGASSAVIGATDRWWTVFLMFLMGMFTGVVWNVITVSFRQTIIPDALLGRVNSVYRFFGWGMMPIGSILGGLVVAAFTPLVGRSDALRWPFFVAAAIHAVLLVYAVPRLSSARLAAAREAAELREVVDQAGESHG